MILGLDISTDLGYAILSFELLPSKQPSVVCKGNIQFKPMPDRFERYAKYAIRIMELVERYQPKLVVIEGHAHASKFSQQVTYEIGTIIRYFLWQEDCDVIEVAPTALKKFTTGSGNAKKEQMMLDVFKRWGIDCKTNDEADAVALAMFGAAKMHLISVPKVQMEPVCKVCGKKCK